MIEPLALLSAAIAAPVAFVFWPRSKKKAARKKLAKSRESPAYAVESGWRQLTGPVPAEVAAACASKNCRLAMEIEREGRRCWVVWQSGTKSDWFTLSFSSWQVTYFYLELGEGYPDFAVERRGSVGALARSAATDDEFDQTYIVRSDPDFPHAVFRLLTPDVRRAMLAREIPDWSITDGLLQMVFYVPPREENLMPTVERLVRLSGLFESR